MGKDKLPKHPFVSICMPTFNRRPFIPIIIECFNNQTYPKDKIEWIIIDDGTDKIEDLVINIPQVKYFKYDQKMTLGVKRNLTNSKASGDIIIYMDDDDYYPPERISHAVETLRKNPKALCAGSSEMYIYFKHIQKMYKFGPYGPNHATAATFAFRKELLKLTRFDENSSVAEEKKFLKDYTIPFVQLDPKKSILVFSHTQNSFDKKELLNQGPNPFINETSFIPSDFVKEPNVLKFFMEDIDDKLNSYDPGRTDHKTDVTKQLANIKIEREKMIYDHIKKETEYNETMTAIHMLTNPQILQQRIEELEGSVKELSNNNKFLDNKIRTFTNEKFYEEDNSDSIIKKNTTETNHIILKQYIDKLENVINQLSSKNKLLNEKLKSIIAEKIQEKKNKKQLDTGEANSIETAGKHLYIYELS
jgi:glycosyltransferase involved in cell wall biosynthesis